MLLMINMPQALLPLLVHEAGRNEIVGIQEAPDVEDCVVNKLVRHVGFVELGTMCPVAYL
jgi:hypothetical protein